MLFQCVLVNLLEGDLEDRVEGSAAGIEITCLGLEQGSIFLIVSLALHAYHTPYTQRSLRWAATANILSQYLAHAVHTCVGQHIKAPGELPE